MNIPVGNFITHAYSSLHDVTMLENEIAKVGYCVRRSLDPLYNSYVVTHARLLHPEHQGKSAQNIAQPRFT
jgi:hypothetical protein